MIREFYELLLHLRRNIHQMIQDICKVQQKMSQKLCITWKENMPKTSQQEVQIQDIDLLIKIIW